MAVRKQICLFVTNRRVCDRQLLSVECQNGLLDRQRLSVTVRPLLLTDPALSFD